MTETTTRRDFLTTSAVAGSLALAPGLFAGQNSALKVGLVGCGGRGTGAAKNALKADSNVKLVATQVDVKPDMCFTGVGAYQKVIDS